jgi:SAM-dependent methyltransferase
VKPWLVDYTVCPVDKAPLRLEPLETQASEVVTGSLSCPAGHTYEIRQGVPRLLTPEARASQTEDSFSAKWRRIPDFGHEERSRDFYVNWYLQRYGFDGMEGLRAFLSEKKMILDAGTGLGRDALLYGENSRAQVFALDLSDTVDFAYEHAGHLPNVHVLQADLTTLPFPEGSFDFLACDQVLHHTPDTARSFSSLCRHLSPGGEIAVYVYKKKAPIREFCDDFLRDHFTKAPAQECYEFARTITLLGRALSELDMEFELPEDIPKLGLKAGRHDVQRFIYWNILKCYWNPRLDLETNIMTNFDWYHPEFAHRHTPEEVEEWCREAGLQIVHFDVVDSGISVRARKSTAGAAMAPSESADH